jgi:[ribosomal protein S5]-alanine N-acetyltransferase
VVNYRRIIGAAEAVQAIVEFGFRNLKLHSIIAKVSPENRGAVFILESLGFEKEAHFKDGVYFKNKFSDMAVYTLFLKNFKPLL